MQTFRPDINPEILQWARNWAEVDIGTVVSRFPKYLAWEAGESYPTMKQLERLSRLFKTPFGYFFLSRPPLIQLDIPDFRTVDDDGPQVPSPDLVEIVEQMQARQDWMKGFLKDQGASELSFVGSVNLQSKVEEVADNMREIFGLSPLWASEFGSQDSALKHLREAIEAQRIMVVIMGYAGRNTRRTLNVEEFRGFVLSDKIAPLVFINGRDAKVAQMFTLAHELAHVWLDQDALFDLPKLVSNDGNAQEMFCNRVAAEFLVPTSDFMSKWKEVVSFPNRYYRLALTFKVSQIVVARKALDLGLIHKAAFFEFYDEHIEAYFSQKEAKNSKGGDYWNTQGVRVGRLFGSAIVQAVKEGRLLYTDAFELTGFKSGTFDAYAERIGVTL